MPRPSTRPRALHFEPLEDRCLMAQTVGLFANRPGAFDGYTLFAPSTSTRTFLIDNQGQRVHSWQSRFPPMSAYLLENGDLLRVARLSDTQSPFNAPGAAGRIERFNWEGELVWSFELSNFSRQMHHDIEIMPNGNILAIAWERKSREQAIAQGRNPAFLPSGQLWPDTIIEIQPTGSSGGQIVWEWKMWDHLIQNFDSRRPNFGAVAQHPELINLNWASSGVGAGFPPSDWAHVNAIDYNPALDQIIISPREFSELWIIDHSTTTAQARGHTGGNSGMGGDLLYRWGNPRTYGQGSRANQKMSYQHDTQWINPGLPGAGNIILFDNGWNRPDGSYSSAMEIVPPLKHQWFLNNRLDGTTTGRLVFDTGNVPANWLPIAGDWNADGRDTIGLYDPVARRFHLNNATDGSTSGVVAFNVSGAATGIPLVGDWDGDGADTVGLYDAALRRFYLSNQEGSWDSTPIIFDAPALGTGLAPLAGDWDGDGDDSAGLYDSATQRWFLNNESSSFSATPIQFSTPPVPATWKPLAGDWNGNGLDTVGLYDPVGKRFYLNNRVDGTTTSLIVLNAASPQPWRPLVGDWNGDNVDSTGTYDPTYRFGTYLRNPGAAFGPAFPKWRYIGQPPGNFFAPIISGVQRLPNGNTLITEGTKGNIFEVTPDKRIVWRYVNPVIASGPLRQGAPIPNSTIGIAGVKANLVFRADRYAPNYPGLIGRDLSPKGRIELPALAAAQAAPATDAVDAALLAALGETSLPRPSSVTPEPVGKSATPEASQTHQTALVRLLSLWPTAAPRAVGPTDTYFAALGQSIEDAELTLGRLTTEEYPLVDRHLVPTA